jgi:hypothetical protein
MAEFGEFDVAPSRDWRDDLIERYEARGFYQHVAVPAPPKQPQMRVVKRLRPAYDYDTKHLPWKSQEDADEAANYDFLRRSLEKRYGQDNVFVAFPTEAMEVEHPEYAEQPHHLFMVRPPENLNFTFNNNEAYERIVVESLIRRIGRRRTGQ